MTDKIKLIAPEFLAIHQEMLREWNDSDPLSRAEHRLSNSELYQKIQKHLEWESNLEFVYYDHQTDQYRYRIKD